MLIQKQVSQHDVSGLLQGRGEDGVLIAGSLKVTNFLQERWRSAGREFSLKLSAGLPAPSCSPEWERWRRRRLRARPQPREALDQPGIRFSRQRKRSQLLQSSLIDADDDDAIVVRARTRAGQNADRGFEARYSGETGIRHDGCRRYRKRQTTSRPANVTSTARARSTRRAETRPSRADHPRLACGIIPVWWGEGSLTLKFCSTCSLTLLRRRHAREDSRWGRRRSGRSAIHGDRSDPQRPRRKRP